MKAAPGYAKDGGMDSSRAIIMASSGDRRWGYIVDDWRAWKHYSPGALLCAKGDRVWILRLQVEGNLSMAEQSSAIREICRGGVPL